MRRTLFVAFALSLAVAVVVGSPVVASAKLKKSEIKQVLKSKAFKKEVDKRAKSIVKDQSGEKGDKGDRGAPGAAGATGAQGPAGSNGTNGSNGARGPIGPSWKLYFGSKGSERSLGGGYFETKYECPDDNMIPLASPAIWSIHSDGSPGLLGFASNYDPGLSGEWQSSFVAVTKNAIWNTRPDVSVFGNDADNVGLDVPICAYPDAFGNFDEIEGRLP